MARPFLLMPIFVAWVIACLTLGAVVWRRAPAVSIALVGGVLGAVVGFLIGDADGPAEVPAYTASGSSLGLVAGAVVGQIFTSVRVARRSTRVIGIAVLCTAPLAAAALWAALRFACPLYVTGREAGFCTYQGEDLLGGWLSGVIAAFLFDAAVVGSLLLFSARQPRRAS